MSTIFETMRTQRLTKVRVQRDGESLSVLDPAGNLIDTAPFPIDRLTDRMLAERHEHLDFHLDDACSGAAVVAVHSSRLGRPYGGLRRISPTVYSSPREAEWAAIDDALRLSRAMSFKCAGARMKAGGSKIVVLGAPDDPALDTEAYYRFVADCINDSGTVTGPDMGFTLDQAATIARSSPHIVGYAGAPGGGPTGETAGFGVFMAMKVCARFRWGRSDLGGRGVAIQGVGRLGAALTECLAAEGAELILADPDEEALKTTLERIRPATAKVVPPEAILSEPCDILAPCAMGAVLDADAIAALRCEVVCGGANNPLARDEEDAARLHERGILYAVDWIANAGGVLNGEEAYRCRTEGQPFGLSRVLVKTYRACYEGLGEILEAAQSQGGDPLQAAYGRYGPSVLG